jgi:hypothetical protein
MPISNRYQNSGDISAAAVINKTKEQELLEEDFLFAYPAKYLAFYCISI